MKNKSPTPVYRTHLFWKVLQFPLTRIIIGILFVSIGIAVAQVIIALLERGFGLSSPLPLPFDLLEIVLAVLATYLAYYAYMHLVEQRPVRELERRGAVRELGIGLLLGIGLSTLVVGILWLMGAYHVMGINDWSVLIVALVADLPSAFIQQVLLLGIFFRITEQVVGTQWALLLSVLLFGLVHLLIIPHITVMDTLGILLGGLLFATTYLLTRTLWLPIGLHTAWEVTKDGIFGVGVAFKGLLQATLTGPTLVTGGASGVQASLVTLVMLVAVNIYLIVRAKQKGQMVKPLWKHEKPQESQGTLSAN